MELRPGVAAREFGDKLSPTPGPFRFCSRIGLASHLVISRTSCERISALPIRVDFDMGMDEVFDEAFTEEAEEFAGAVMAAVGGVVEFELALAVGALARMRTLLHGRGGWPHRAQEFETDFEQG